MSHRSEVIYDYHRWVVSLVDVDDNLITHYSSLLHEMDDIEYIPGHRLDNNRVLDGLRLREEYDIDVNPFDEDVVDILGDKPCSLLECYVALCKRYSDTQVDAGDPSIAPEIFYDILSNLDVLEYSDGEFWFHPCKKLTQKLQKPTPFWTKPPRKMDLWMQIGKYFIDKYGLC